MADVAPRIQDHFQVHCSRFWVCQLCHIPYRGSLLTLHIKTTCRTHLLEYSLSMASVISIGHLSTSHLAAVTLGSMTSAVCCFTSLPDPSDGPPNAEASFRLLD